MKTKPIPIIIVLIAAGISCVASIIQGVSFDIFTKRLLISVICFSVIGVIVRVVIDRAFKTMEPEEENTEDAEEIEDVSTEEQEE